MSWQRSTSEIKKKKKNLGDRGFLVIGRGREREKEKERKRGRDGVRRPEFFFFFFLVVRAGNNCGLQNSVSSTKSMDILHFSTEVKTRQIVENEISE